MNTNHSKTSSELRFIDPTVDPAHIFEISKDVFQAYSAIRAIKEMLQRFPAVEYAVGFDGIDDFISVEDVLIGKYGMEFGTNIWVPKDVEDNVILEIADSDGNMLMNLASISVEDSAMQIHYRANESIQKNTLSKFEFESWQDLRIWSDGGNLSIEVDGDQVALVSNIDLENGPLKFFLGMNTNSTRHFRGMVKFAQLRIGSKQIFNLQADNSNQIADKNNRVKVAGIHDLKKERFQNEFRVNA